jgi:uncharacterized repeat protein (TIGR01451 family)/CSLREA domain-containing protein
MRRLGAAAALAVAVALVTAAPALATTDFFYPNTTADTVDASPDCGATPSGPCSLRDAVRLADQDPNDAAVVLAANGQYVLTQGTTMNISSRSHTVTIEGDNGTIDASGNGTSQYPLSAGSSFNTSSLELDDVTLTGTQGTPWVLFDGIGDLTINNVTFSGNTSDSAGPAGLDVGEVGTLTVGGARFTANQGAQGQFLAGMELEDVRGSAAIDNVSFDHNAGAAFFADFNVGPVSMHDITILGDTNAQQPQLEIGAGTGAGFSLSTIDVEGNTVSSNDPTVLLDGTFPQLDNITIAGNTVARRTAGAELNLTGTATANNWTVANNQVQPANGFVPVAGGIEVSTGTLRLNHATVTGNSAGGNADDLHTFGTGSITVLNSIIAGSSANGAVPCAADGGPITSGGHNIDLGSSCAFNTTSDMSNTDPKLGQLTTNYLPETEPLLYGSPAVNAADSTNCPATDAIGTARPQGAACDIGAIEAPLTNLAVAISPSATRLPAGGGQVTYTMSVSNLSGVTPADVQLTDSLPGGAAFVSASSSAGVCRAGAQIVCDLGPVHRGANVTVTITARLHSAGANVDVAHVQSAGPDSDMSNDNASATTTVAGSVSQLHIGRRRFRAQGRHGGPGGTTIIYVDSAAGTTTLRVLRCVAPHGRRCKALVPVGRLSHHDRRGRNSLHFSGRLNGHALPPGSYVLIVTPAGGKPKTITFAIIG